MTMTAWIIIKYLITATIVICVSEFAKHSDRLGGLIAALPLVTLLTLFWLYIEKQPIEKISNHAYYTMWYVIPTLPFFVIFPLLLAKFKFWPAIMISAIVTVFVFWVFALLMKRFGIHLI